MNFAFELLIILLMLAVNAVFAAYEMALASLSRARIAILCQQKRKGAAEAAHMKDRMEASLAVVQLGITLAGAVAAATGGAGAQESFTPLFVKLGLPSFYAEIAALVSVVVPLGAFTIVFAELVPKMLALHKRESVCLALSPVMKGIAKIAYPIVASFEAVVKKIVGLTTKGPNDGPAEDKQSLYELTAAAALARTSRLIGAHEEKIVLSAAQLSRKKVSDIMLDTDYMSSIPADDSLSSALIKAHLDMHTRFPVCEAAGDPQTIIGYLNFKDIVNALKLSPESPSVRGITRPIKKLREETALSQALSEMMRERAHIAIIVSGDDSVMGMITLEDIIEELIGEIEDEFDRLPTHVQPCGSGWIMGGAVSMKVVVSTIGVGPCPEDTPEQALPLAEWVTRKLGRDVASGEVLALDGISITVRKLRRRKLAEAIVSKAADGLVDGA